MIDTVSLDRKDLRVLLLEGINETAVDLFAAAGFEKVERLPKALDGEDLRKALAEAHVVGIRSRTRITADVLAAAPNLVTIGCFSVGTNQVDLAAARRRGVPVFNAPFSNTRSVAELVLGQIVMLMRGIFPKSVAAHRGEWIKSAANSWEVRGKTLGIVGYGNIGTQLSVLAESFGMRVWLNRSSMLEIGRRFIASSISKARITELTGGNEAIPSSGLAASPSATIPVCAGNACADITFSQDRRNQRNSKSSSGR